MKERRLISVLIAILVVYEFMMLTKHFATHHSGSNEGNLRELLDSSKIKMNAPPVCPKDPTICKYDGHCLVGETCVMTPECGNRTKGVCEFYAPSRKTTTVDAEDNSIQQQCLRMCQFELEWDERFYYYSKINVLQKTTSIHSYGRPDGCILVYNRLLNEYDINVPDDTIRAEWLNRTSAHHIVRVDPVPKTNGKTWKAFCYNPCRTDADCAPKAQSRSSRKAYVCLQGACQKNRNEQDSYWVNPQAKYKDLVLVTGANSGYFNGLKNLVASARYWAPRNRMVVYNLGLTEEQLTQVETWSNVMEIRWKKGIPLTYPAHVHVGKKYAWKPIAINESISDFGMIFWLDAGNTLTGPTDAAEWILEQTGLFLVKGQDRSMAPVSHEKTYEWFGYNKTSFQFSSSPHYSGNTQGFLKPSRYYAAIVEPNAKCATDENCVAPPGSNLRNHRYDQTTLSILAYGPEVQAPHHTEYLACCTNQMKQNLSEPNFMFVWTARQGCEYYTNQGY
jgi:hypothetical protein